MNLHSAAILPLILLTSTMVSQAADESIVAKVGESEVRVADIKPLLKNLPARDQAVLARDPAALKDIVRALIVQQLVYKEALSKKWEQQPQIVAQLERLRQQAITQSYLQALATPPDTFPSSADLQAAYDTLKKSNALQVPKQYHLQQIYIACPKGTDKATEEKGQAKLDATVKQLKEGDFSVVAKSQSDDAASAPNGGDLGWLAEAQIQPEIRAQVVSLSKGGTTPPIRMNDGWHFVRLVETKDPYTATMDEVKVSLTNELRSQQAQTLNKAYLAKILQQNPITLNEIAVSNLLDKKGN